MRSTASLPPNVRADFLDLHDPVQKFGLTDDTVLFRITEKKYLDRKGLAGNPKSCAQIMNHEAVTDSPLSKLSAEAMGMTQGMRNELLADPVNHFAPVRMSATDLTDPSLNVMFGSGAAAGVRGYAQGSDVAVVKMKLGDFRKAGGGTVFTDVGAMGGGSSQCRALIVTLPKGKHVPVQVIG